MVQTKDGSGEYQMSKEAWTIIAVWTISIIIFIGISKNKIRLMQITVLFAQTLSWVTVYILISFNIVKFPYREFKVATEMGFTHYYIVFPVLTALFIRFYPEQSGKAKQILYLVIFSTASPTIYVLVESFTSLIEFINYNWAVHVAGDILLLYTVKKFVFWFKKGLKEP